MPEQVVDLGSVVCCAHGGLATPVEGTARVRVARRPVVTLATTYVIANCPSDDPSARCLSGRWDVGADRVLAEGTPVALQSSGSSTSPTAGPMLALVVQQRVSAS